MDRVEQTIRYLERRVDHYLKKVDAFSEKYGGDVYSSDIPIREFQAWWSASRLAGELSIVLMKLDDRNESTKICMCPECGWKTRARTTRGINKMVKQHSEKTGHSKFTAVYVKKEKEIPF